MRLGCGSESVAHDVADDMDSAVQRRWRSVRGDGVEVGNQMVQASATGSGLTLGKVARVTLNLVCSDVLEMGGCTVEEMVGSAFCSGLGSM